MMSKDCWNICSNFCNSYKKLDILRGDKYIEAGIEHIKMKKKLNE